MNLRVIPATKAKPDEKLISELKEMLAKAEAGEILSIATTCEYATGELGYFWLHGHVTYPTKLIGAVAQLQWSMLNAKKGWMKP